MPACATVPIWGLEQAVRGANQGLFPERAFADPRRPCDSHAGCGGDDAGMERIDLLIGFLAFGAAVMTLWAWLWSSLTQGDR